ncbi:MAG: NADH-quinone oxidoreductase subunit A [Dehalococcoidia bacterium]|nr:NADH-quinone oxidoreductase subunit A [Dehalococcoidia bacterium]
MLQDFSYIALFLLISIAFAAFMLVLPLVLRKLGIIPHKPSAVKSSTVECGLETTGRSWVQFNSRYYLFALVAVALDVMLIFILPWAAGLQVADWRFFLGGAIFVGIILIAYIYAWRKGALRWK